MSAMAPRRRWAGVATVVVALAGMGGLTGCGSSRSSSSSASGGPRTGTQTGTRTGTGTGTRTTRAAAGPAPCRGAQLATSYDGTQGATGHLELTLALRNVSAQPCRIEGYPGARLIDAAGRALPLRVQRGHGFFPDTQSPPAPIVLQPGATAHYGISFATNNEYAGAHVCRNAATALSAAPGPAARWERVSLRRGVRITPCGGQLIVSPVHA